MLSKRLFTLIVLALLLMTDLSARSALPIPTAECPANLIIKAEECVTQHQTMRIAVLIQDASSSPFVQRQFKIKNSTGAIIFETKVELSANHTATVYYDHVALGDEKIYMVYYGEGCTKEVLHHIKTMPEYSFDITPISCADFNDGSVKLNTASSQLNLIWQNGEVKSEVKNLAADTYSVTVTNTNGCSLEKQVVINNPQKLALNFKDWTIDCDNNTTNYIKAEASGGQSPYSYDWAIDGSGDFDDDQVLTNINSGIFELTVRDARGCMLFEKINAVFNQSQALTANDGKLLSTQEMDNGKFMFHLPKAEDIKNGDIDNDGFDGSTYEVSYYSSKDNAEASILPLPEYYEAQSNANVVAKIENTNSGCFKLTSVSLFAEKFCFLKSEACDNDPAFILEPIECTLDQTPLPSNGTYTAFKLDNGLLTPAPYVLFFDGTNYYFDPTENGGNYRIEYTYQDGANTITRVAFVDIQDVNPQILFFENQICGNSSDLAEIRVNPVGGHISGVAIVDSLTVGTNKFYYVDPTQLSVGSTNLYSYTYFQYNGSSLVCSKTATAQLFVTDYPKVTIGAINDFYCQTEDVNLSAIINSSLTYSTSWHVLGTNQIIGQTDNIIFSDIQDTTLIYVQVIDENGCIGRDTVQINSIPKPKLICSVELPNKCHDNEAATITVKIDDPFNYGPYTYSWNNGLYTGDVVTNLGEGTYTVAVTNSKNCVSTCQVEVINPTPITLSCSIVKHVSCFGGTDGVVSIAASGGTGSLQFSLDNITYQNGSIFDNLKAGNYTVYAKDANGCVETCSIEVTQPSVLTVNIDKNDVACHGAFTGSISIGVAGGTLPYTTLWNNNETGLSIDNLKAGNYSVLVTDSKGCFLLEEITIEEPPKLEINTADISLCLDRSTIIEANPIGGNPAYHFDWSIIDPTTTGATNADIEVETSSSIKFDASYLNLGDVLLEVTTTDNNLCVIKDTTAITLEACYDLALQKIVTTPAPYYAGNEVEFSITLYNQGTIDAFEIVVQDTLDDDLVFAANKNLSVMTGNEANWTAITSNIITTNISSLKAGESKTIKLILEIDPNVDKTFLVNNAVITNSSNGVRTNPVDEDTYDGSNPHNEVDDDVRDESIGDVDNPEDEDRFDFAIINLCQPTSLPLSIDKCVEETIVAQGVDLNLANLSDDIDIFGDGDGSTNDGDNGNLVESLHHSMMDAFMNNNKIVFPVNFNRNYHFWSRTVDVNQCISVQPVNAHFDVKPILTLQPIDIDVDLGDINACLVAVTNYNQAAYQWQIKDGVNWVNLPNAQQNSFCIPVIEASNDGEEYRVILNDNGNASPSCAEISEVAIINVNLETELACNDLVNISLDDNCQILLLPDHILEGNYPTDINIVIKDGNGNIVANPITSDYVGQTLYVYVYELSTGNLCWSKVFIEDKLGPKINCPADITISCANSTYLPPLPTAIDACEGPVTVTRTANVLTEHACTPEGIIATRVITYEAVDSHGNKSLPCYQTISYFKNQFEAIDFPNDVELECTTTLAYPTPGLTGYPTLDGYPLLISNNDQLCRVNVAYSDSEIPLCGVTYKILRLWTIIDWCTGDIAQEYQAIAIRDTKGPVFACPTTMFTAQVQNLACSVDWKVPVPTVTDACNSVQYSVSYAAFGETIFTTTDVSFNGSQYTISNLATGKWVVKYTAKDACGNTSTCTINLTVVDSTLPTAVCKEYTVVSLTSSGLGRIYAASIDNGSHDNCSKLTYGVRRLSSNCGTSAGQTFIGNYQGNAFYNYVDFCCADLGQSPIKVQLLVIDESGNKNVCDVEVEIQQKNVPTITCPSNITVDCGTDPTPQNIGSQASFVDICPHYVMNYSDNTVDLGCGTKNITRTWVLKNSLTNQVAASCSQYISVKNLTPNALNVNWPSAVTLTNQCQGSSFYGPDNAATGGYPTVSGDGCSMIGITYQDQLFEVVEDACFKILREWTVIDWCNFDQSNPSLYTKKYVQVIKVIDSQKPSISCIAQTFEVNQNCTVAVSTSPQFSDNCTPNDVLVVKYSVDAGADGSFESQGNVGKVFSRSLSPGTYLIRWTVEDKCGNIATCDQTITVLDRIAPTPYCHSELVTVLMPTSLCVEISAKDFDLGAKDNCLGNVYFSFHKNLPINLALSHYYKHGPNGTSVYATEAEYLEGLAEHWNPQTGTSSQKLNCLDRGLKTYTIYVFDDARNADFCTVQLSLEDHGNLCSGSRIAAVEGKVTTPNEEPYSQVEIKVLNSEGHIVGVDTTAEDGSYSIQELPAETPLTLQASKFVPAKEGVNTLDLALIQKHILGSKKFEKEWQKMAADVNHSNSISVTDILEIRRIVLQVDTVFKNTASVVFVQDNTWSQNGVDLNLQADSTYVIDLLGIKMGDVNSSYIPSYVGETLENRNASPLTLALHTFNYTQVNGNYLTPVYPTQKMELMGMEFAIDLHDVHYAVGIKPGSMAIDENHWSVVDGILRMSFNSEKAQNYSSDMPLFYIESSQPLTSSNNMWESQSSGFYFEDDLEAQNIRFSVSDKKEQVVIHQNVPNPFHDLTTVDIELTKPSKVLLTIISIDGKLHRKIDFNLSAGLNQITLDKDKLGLNAGGYIAKWVVDDFVQTNKMLIIE